MSLKQFQIISKLGEGAYSSVYKVFRVEDNQIYALKRVKLMNLSAKQRQNALNQIRILASIRHPNIVCYKEAFIDQNSKSLCIVMEYATDGDLSKKLSQMSKNNQIYQEQEIWQILIQMIKGLRELHSLNIFHRDIKPANIFLHEGGIIKIGDLNVSKISQKGLCVTQTGTPYYASPEVWKDEPYNQKSDIWSLGCVLYEMITFKPPFKSEDMEGLFKKVTRGIYSRIPSEYSQDLSSMIRSLLQINPHSRPSCKKIMEMPVVLKRKGNKSQFYENKELLKTIKATSFQQIGQNLPKPNYVPLKMKKTKNIKSLIDSLDQKEQKEQKEMYEVESLPALQKQKKIFAYDNSERINKEKMVKNVMRDRKKSDFARSNPKLEVEGLNKMQNGNELKLPKVQNRYQKVKERLHKQKSLRYYKYIQN